MDFHCRKKRLFTALSLLCTLSVAYDQPRLTQATNHNGFAQSYPLVRMPAGDDGEAVTDKSDKKPQTIEEIFEQVDHFLLGFKYNELVPSALNCS